MSKKKIPYWEKQPLTQADVERLLLCIRRNDPEIHEGIEKLVKPFAASTKIGEGIWQMRKVHQEIFRHVMGIIKAVTTCT